jgi:hypothetical protein
VFVPHFRIEMYNFLAVLPAFTAIFRQSNARFKALVPNFQQASLYDISDQFGSLFPFPTNERGREYRLQPRHIWHNHPIHRERPVSQEL